MQGATSFYYSVVWFTLLESAHQLSRDSKSMMYVSTLYCTPVMWFNVSKNGHKLSRDSKPTMYVSTLSCALGVWLSTCQRTHTNYLETASLRCKPQPCIPHLSCGSTCQRMHTNYLETASLRCKSETLLHTCGVVQRVREYTPTI